MQASERRLVWVSAGVLVVCALGAMNAIWPSAVKAHAEAVVQGVSQPLVVTPAPAPPSPVADPAAGPPETPELEPDPVVEAPESDVPGVNVLWVTFDHDGRTLRTTIRYPAAPGRYPVVVFAHGFAASAATYATLQDRIAGAGFVVAAPDFPHSSSAVSDWLDRGDVVNQAGDVSAVIDLLLDPATVPAELRGIVAPGPAGVIGHSDGGITAAGVAYNSQAADPRIGAAVILSGARVMFGGSWFHVQSPPFLAIHGDADGVNPYWSSEQLFDGATGPKWLVRVLGGSHGGPFVNWPVVEQVATLTADFLRAYLSGDSAAQTRIEPDANADGLALDAAA